MYNKCKILVVDDSPMIHALMRRAFDNDDFLICGYGKNGKDGVEKYKELSPDVVTMDITMPIMDGLQASREILKLNSEAKIIMLSAMGDEEIMEEARKIGIKHFVKKPFLGEELLATVKKILEA